MATQTDHGKRKGGGERAKIEVGGGGRGGGGGIIVIGCALIGAAIGAAFVAHRGRGSSHRGNARKVDQEEEKGLQTLLPSADSCGDRWEGEASSVDSQESASDKSEIGGYSSTESGAEVVWPSEVIEQQKEIDELKQISEVSEIYREEEYSSDSSVEIEETICKDPEIVNQIEADTTDTIDDNIVAEEFSFWSVKSTMPGIHTEQKLAESEIANVPEDGKLEPKEEIEEFLIKEEGEKREKGSEIIDALAETNEMKQQLEISGKTEKISVSESEDRTRQLQNLLPATYSVEQQNGHILVDSSEGTQDNNACSDLDKEMETPESRNTCENFEVVVETRENQSETYMNSDINLVKESDISHIEEEQGSSSINSREEIELQVENVGEKEEEKSEELRSSVEFSDHEVLPADIIEQDEHLEDSVIAHKEVVEEEQEEEKGDDEQEDTPVNSLEEEIRSPVEEVSKREGQMEKETSPKDFDGKEVWPAEAASKELSEAAAWPAKPIMQEEPPSAVTNEMKHEEYISEKTEDTVGSEAEDNTRTLQNLIPSTDSLEQEKGCVLGTSEENKVSSCNDFKKTEMVVEEKEKQSEDDTCDDNGLVQEPDICHEEEEEEEKGSSVNIEEEIEMPVKDAGDKGEEESEGSRNSSVEFDDQVVLPADSSEQEKMDGSMSITAMKHPLEIPREHEETDCSAEGDTKYKDNLVQESLSNGVEFNIPDEENGVDLGDSEIDNVEPEEVVEEEQEEKGDDEQEGLSAKSLEEKIMSDVEEENEREESIVTANSSKEFDFKVNKSGIDWEGSESVHVEAEEVEEDQEEKAGCYERQNSLVKSLEEEICSAFEEENKTEEPKGNGNSSMEFDSKGNETGVDSEDSKIVHVESEVVVEQEQEQEQRGDDKQESSSVKYLEEEIMLDVEEENEREESIVTDNSSKDIDFNVNETCIDWAGSEIVHVEVAVVDEGQEEKRVYDKREGLSVKSLEEEICSTLDEENEREEPKGNGNSFMEFDSKGNATGVDSEESEIVHLEAEIVEGHEESGGNDKQEGSSVKSLEEEIMLNVEEENEREESKEKSNSFVEFESKGKKTGVDSEDSEIVHIEGEIVEEKVGDNKQEGSSVKSLEGEIMSVAEEENEKEESIRTGNSSIEFDTKGVWPAELVELENGPVPMCEMKQLPENLEKINPIIGVVQAEGDENTTGESAKEIQEKVCMNLHAETEGSQNTCKNSEMATEIKESQPVPNIDHGDDIAKECSYDDSISNISQEQNNQDLEESNTSHGEKEVENTSMSLQEAEIESSIEEDSERENEEPEEKKDSSTQTEVIEKEEGLPLVENEMKLQSEIAKKTTGVVDIEQAKKEEDEVHEQDVLKKEPEIMDTDKEKRMDFMLNGFSKVFLLVLALTMALGLLAFAHHDHLHNYKHRLPEIYRQLSQLFFPSHNGGIGEL